MPTCLVDQTIIDLIEPNSKVLDLGCGDGRLLASLVEEKKVRAQGIEISEEAIYACVEKGLNVYHGDIEGGLSEYPDDVYDYVVLNRTLQEVKQVDFVLQEAMRVGNKVIVAFPNFVHLAIRLQMVFSGRAPVTRELPNPWYETPSVRFLSIQDFLDYARAQSFKIIETRYLNAKKRVYFLPNLLASVGVFVIQPNHRTNSQ